MAEGFFRWVLLNIARYERALLARARRAPKGRAAQFIKSGVLNFSRDAISRGMAVGMFWGFVPMPFQMVPAAVFCLLTRANLPLALICVWISNPFTYVPIFYIEYKIGVWLFGGGIDMNWDDFSQRMSGGDAGIPWDNILPILETLLKGALVTSIFMSVLGYLAGLVMFRYLQARRQKKLSSAATDASHAG